MCPFRPHMLCHDPGRATLEETHPGRSPQRSLQRNMTPTSTANRRKKGWGLLSPHGTVLLWVALHPGSTRGEIAQDLQLTERSIWSIIRDLQTTDAIRLRRENGRVYYSVNLSAPLWEPLLSGHTVGSIVREFAKGGGGSHRQVHEAREPRS